MGSSDAAHGRAFIKAMPPELSRQAGVLSRLLAQADQSPSWRWLELSCSLGRGVGDRWSDIDAGLGVATFDVATVVESVVEAVSRLGELVDLMRQPMAFGAEQAVHVFAQYADGVQLSLVVAPSHVRKGLPPQAVALYDADGRLGAPWSPASLRASAADLREWTFLGWVAVCDAVKYLARGSLWEAHAAVERARSETWKLWAAAAGADYPGFGLTSLLDLPEPRVAPAMDATVATLEAASLRSALHALTGQLAAATDAANVIVPYDVPTAMASYARSLVSRACPQ